MIDISLLVIEDEDAAEVYNQVHSEIADWLLVRKGIVRLRQAIRDDQRWVTNLEDWRRVIGPLAQENELVFCIVDLAIPESAAGGVPSAENGLKIVQEIRARPQEGVRCCVLTGLSGSDLLRLIGERESIPEILFDFKGDVGQGYRNIVGYVKSQVLSLIESVSFPDSNGSQHTILLRDRSSLLHENFLSKAVYYVDAPTWHVPTMLIGVPGLGRRTLVEFIAYLADADLTVVDLRATTPAEVRLNFQALQKLGTSVRESPASNDRRRQLYYVANLDQYAVGESAEEGQNCLWPLRKTIETLGTLGPRQTRGFPIGVIVSVSGESRLLIRSQETRSFIRFLEDSISETTNLPLNHLGMNRNGWSVSHPRIVAMPTLPERGQSDFVARVIATRLDTWREEMWEDIAGYDGEPLTLADDVLDFFIDKTDWTRHENLGGLMQALTSAFNAFKKNRSSRQFQITREHLDREMLARLRRVVLNVNEVRHEFSKKGGRELVINRADFHVDEGELLAILGPSGCGKSTLLRMLAGLLKPTSGSVTYLTEPITRPTEEIGFIFQNFSLFPWLTVRQNLVFGPKTRGLRPRDFEADVDRLLDIAQLAGHEHKYPHQLSGGMQQRLAIVRALANQPAVLLMDEPFASLDVQTRWQMQNFLIGSIKESRDASGRVIQKNTIVFVTHDIDEAVYVGNRLYVGTPRPLVLSEEDEIRIPFSAGARRDSLRTDPVFTALVTKVRDALLLKASTDSKPAAREGWKR